ncbi:hypothetical protein [Paenibacillus elgii]|uniref:hypothetical protein n=1 Tax=Paenibacillus elgii TaxID=189691 RepID=UPI0013D1DBB9|nr:hypothetical protein [Paenibacillus elgii]
MTQFENAVIKHARQKGWKKVCYTLIYKYGRIPADKGDPVIPDEILNLPVASHHAELREDREDRAMFWSYSENEAVFFDERTPHDTEEPEPVIIVMEPTEKVKLPKAP